MPRRVEGEPEFEHGGGSMCIEFPVAPPPRRNSGFEISVSRRVVIAMIYDSMPQLEHLGQQIKMVAGLGMIGSHSVHG